MTVQDAAIQILLSAGKPLHAKEIAKRAIKAGLWQSEGKTPDASVSARLYSDIKKNGDKFFKGLDIIICWMMSDSWEELLVRVS